MAIYHKIAIFEQSDVICEGIISLLRHSELQHDLIRINSFDELIYDNECQTSIDMLIVNPLLFFNNKKDLVKIQKLYPNLSIVALVSNLMDGQTMDIYSDSISIFDTSQQIITTISSLLKSDKKEENNEMLSERELEVLIQLIHGYTNKEIAEKLNISIHTVVTHRKNITQKTGVKSPSGLAIYALSKNIVSMEDF
ncbi:MAG: hypothetical protein CR965_00525 [Paludibacter sp.]|nr:MAG: hypothetical protein CR965_00525 [Paludibacter sp.]